MNNILWIPFALIHAISAGFRQGKIKKYFSGDSVKSLLDNYLLLAVQYGIAGTAILIFHTIASGSIWFEGEIPVKFWLIMFIFVIANSFAAKLNLKMFQETESSLVLLLVSMTSGLMVLADGVWFGKWPKPLGWLGILMINIPFFFSKTKDINIIASLTRLVKSKDSRPSWSLLGQSVTSLVIYNFITPATNKACVLMTSATFTSWMAHLGIAVALFFAAVLTKKKGLVNLADSVGGRRKLFLIFLMISVPMAFSNALASFSFQLGAVIPGVYMLKRVLPASYYYWRKEGKLNTFHATSIVLAISGAVLMAL